MINSFKQTQVDFVNIDQIFYKRLVYSFYDTFNENFDYNSKMLTSINNNQDQLTPISTTDRWHNYQQINGEQTYDDILSLLKNNQKQISELRGHPVIAYLTAINTDSSSSQINLNNRDIKEFASLIADIDENICEIDVILHSYGGYIESAHVIIELLRDRFKKVNFLIPFTAHSAASMMCMAADEIIMTPESSLSPFDVQVLSPDDNKTYLPAQIMKECAKEAKKANNFFNIFTPKSLYEKWDGKMIRKTKLFCDISIKQSKSYPMYWLMKYMFKSSESKNLFFINFLFMPLWKRFTSNGRKANNIVKLFVNTGIKLSHSTPIMYNDLKDTGLNISKADNQLLSLMRETYQLADALFHSSTIKKIYTSSDKSFFKYSKT